MFQNRSVKLLIIVVILSSLITLAALAVTAYFIYKIYYHLTAECIDSCASSPCANGGHCVNDNNFYKCDCLVGYTGQICQTIIRLHPNVSEIVDICTSSPCVNGGRCESGIDFYRCNCPRIYTGKHCQTETLDYCASSPCVNNSQCESGVDVYQCKCSAGFTGTQCQTVINNCASMPCLNGSTCINRVNSFTCICAAGYTGTMCEQNTMPCNSSPCLNNGSCANLNNLAYNCTCDIGFLGQRCELSACSNYTELKDTWRGIDENKSLSHCDRDWLKQSWYKLMLRGSVANLVLTAPPLNSCGTGYPIWFNGTLPTNVDQLTKGQGCVTYNGNPCHSEYSVSNIFVKHCDKYNVYFLKPPPNCDVAYCTQQWIE